MPGVATEEDDLRFAALGTGLSLDSTRRFPPPRARSEFAEASFVNLAERGDELVPPEAASHGWEFPFNLPGLAIEYHDSNALHQVSRIAFGHPAARWSAR